MSGIDGKSGDAKVNQQLDSATRTANDEMIKQSKSAEERMRTSSDIVVAKNVMEVMGMAASNINSAASKFDP